jgi:DNA-binding MarR family transcriptional regulator
MSDDPYELIERELRVLMRTITRAKRHDGDNPLHGVEPTALWLLSQLVEYGPHRLTALAAAVQLDVSTVSRQVATLEGRGWVERHPDPDDGRAVLFHPTPEGLALLETSGGWSSSANWSRTGARPTVTSSPACSASSTRRCDGAFPQMRSPGTPPHGRSECQPPSARAPRPRPRRG